MLAGLSVVALAGCSGQSVREQVGRVVRSYESALASRDATEFCALTTESLHREFAVLYGEGGMTAAARCERIAASVLRTMPSLTDESLGAHVSAITINGARARALITSDAGTGVLPLADAGGLWFVSAPERFLRRSWLSLLYRFTPTGQNGASAGSVAGVLGRRALAILGPLATAEAVGHDDERLVVPAPVTSGELALLTRPGAEGEGLAFYDWEANALARNRKLTAGQLAARNPAALEISRGDAAGVGVPGAGSMSLYDAVRLASRRPASPSVSNLRDGPAYYMFGRPRSAACAKAATGGRFGSSARCLLAGPQDSLHELLSAAPVDVPDSQRDIVVVPQGWVVVEAAGGTAGATSDDGTASQFYVLRDDVGLFGDEITDPMPSVDLTGNPDVTFDFTKAGAEAFHRLTAAIARRGATLSGLGGALYQHFAVVLDDRLVAVPSIDFEQYPDGIPADNGGEITGGFTAASAKQTARELAAPPLPVVLDLISSAAFTANAANSQPSSNSLGARTGASGAQGPSVSHQQIPALGQARDGLAAQAALTAFIEARYALASTPPDFNLDTGSFTAAGAS